MAESKSREPAGRPGERSRQRAGGRIVVVLLVAVALCLGGCDPLTVHKVTSTIFDGVPSLPPADQYCKDYSEEVHSVEHAGGQKQSLVKGSGTQSEHPPYAEKQCNGCHDKTSESGFVVPLENLCAHCHKGFPAGEFVHGPVATGACLKCHLPHKSDSPALLVKGKGELCAICHIEPRLAAAMHAKAISNGMFCTDCHDPHSGNNRFFLR